MPTVLRVLPLIVLLVGAGRAEDFLEDAQRARALLGADVWAQIIRIENSARDSVYPRTVHAVVFELVGRLWFYCGVNGTQSFSLHAGRLAEEKADFRPLLQDIAPGFRRWTVIAPASVAPGAPANACFIESFVAFRLRVAEGLPTREPQLLSYYVDTTAGRKGHTVLVYQEPGRTVIHDPAQPRSTFWYSPILADDPLRLARSFEGREVVRARFLPLPAVAVPVAALDITARRGNGTASHASRNWDAARQRSSVSVIWSSHCRDAPGFAATAS